MGILLYFFAENCFHNCFLVLMSRDLILYLVMFMVVLLGPRKIRLATHIPNDRPLTEIYNEDEKNAQNFVNCFLPIFNQFFKIYFSQKSEICRSFSED